ncbi:MAG: Crp/Fnr family transcriptional regulator [Planctomycetota bacterium]|jgi:CRP-like cAMP-binding protein
MKFEDIPQDDIEEYGPEEVVFNNGEHADHMYVVLEGTVELRVGGEAVAEVPEGDVLGEMALLDQSKRSALAVAKGDCRLLPVNRFRFDQMVRKDPGFARLVLRTLAKRLRQSNVLRTGDDSITSSSEITGSLKLEGMEDQKKSFDAGESVFEAGTTGAHMFIVQTGTVELVVGDEIVHDVRPGGFFGEMALVEDLPRSATARAATDIRVLPINRERFEFLVTQTPDFVVEMMRVMSGRLRRMNEVRKGD